MSNVVPSASELEETKLPDHCGMEYWARREIQASHIARVRQLANAPDEEVIAFLADIWLSGKED